MFRNITYFFVSIAIAFSSCKSFLPSQSPASLQPPGTFTGASDTTSIGDMPWSTFFSDPALTRLIDSALQNNLDIKMAAQRVQIAQANFRISRGAFLPSLNVAATAGVDRYGEYTMNGVGNFDTNLSPNIDGKKKIPNPTPDYFLGLRSSWEIDVWGKLRNQKKAAYYRFLASQKGRQAVVTQLVSQIASLYYTLLTNDYELEIIRKNIQLQEIAVETITAQKEAGRATELAVQQASAQLLGTRSLGIAIQQDIVVNENQLNFLLGRFPQPISRGSAINEQQLPASAQAGIPSHLLRRRPDIQQFELELKASQADVAAMRAAFFPSLTISPYIGYNAFDASVLFNPGSLAYGVLGGLVGPVFNRNVLKSNYTQASAVQLESFYNYQRAILSGYQEVITHLRGLENYQRMYDLRKQEVTMLENAVVTSKDLYVTGYASYLEVVTAQRSVLEAELELATTKRNQFFSLIDLYRSVGGGWK